MKYYIRILLIVAWAVCLPGSYTKAKTLLPQVEYSNLQVRYNKKTGNIDLTFDARLSLPSPNYSLMVVPKLAKDGKEVPFASVALAELPSSVMEGEWYKISRLRKQRSGIHDPLPGKASYIPQVSNYTYKASIPQAAWEENVSVVVYTILKTYSGITGQSVYHFPGLLAVMDDSEDTFPEKVAEPRRFVERINDANRAIVAGIATLNTVEEYIEEHWEGSLNIYFETGSSQINFGFMGNSETLSRLLETVNSMQEANNAPHVVIVGYSSPEGSVGHNKRLSAERAWSVQEYIATNSGLSETEIATYEGGINWAGLKRFVQSDYTIPRRNEVLSILEQPVWDSRTQTGRLTSLMRLGGGESYRYLADNYFPQLRGSAFI